MFVNSPQCCKNTENKNRKIVKTNNRRIVFLLKCAVSKNKKSEFIKKQGASGLLKSLAIKASLS